MGVSQLLNDPAVTPRGHPVVSCAQSIERLQLIISKSLELPPDASCLEMADSIVENHGKTIGKPIGKCWLNGIYPLIMTNIAMENHNL